MSARPFLRRTGAVGVAVLLGLGFVGLTAAPASAANVSDTATSS